MKILIIGSAAIPSPTEGYAGLEMITAWLTMECAKRGNDVTLITTNGSPWEGSHAIMDGDKQIGKMTVVGTVDPDWNGMNEQNHYLAYKDLLEKEFSDGNSVVLDHTWYCFSYLSKQKFPEMNLVHSHHGMLGFQTPPAVLHPRFLGLSSYHSQFLSNVLNIPCRHIHNGIPLVQFPADYDPSLDKGDYLLSLNRISQEKGIHDALDIAISTNTKIVIVGDDTKVQSQEYVNDIITRCRNSNGLATYLGLVDNNTKNMLLQKCKAVIACPKQQWLEAFGLYAVEAMAYYKPVIATNNGGLNDIVSTGNNGFLAPNTEKLKQFVEHLDKIDPRVCRTTVEQKFTKEIMATNYLNMCQKIIDKDPTSFW
jgi:glycosyltransferase involved in cell wall biosynthesis